MAGPELPPFSKDVRVRTSSRPCGEDPLWHFAQFASSIGRTSFSNWMPAPAVHGSRHNPLDTRNHFDILQANFDRTHMIVAMLSLYDALWNRAVRILRQDLADHSVAPRRRRDGPMVCLGLLVLPAWLGAQGSSVGSITGVVNNPS